MKVIKTKLLFFIYFCLFFFLIFELLFSEKNIFKLFDNFEIIIGKEIELEEKKKEYSILESFLNDFENSEEYKKIIIKDKLFYKHKDEKILIYESSHQ